ncbi:MAG TPA: dihydroorotase [Terriglobia bacterium]|nr:dihydroorotase [Terriglobia bacterium]
MASLLIKGGHVLSPEDKLDGTFDVLVQNGVIHQIAPDLKLDATDILDAQGLVVCPGFVDLHAHLRVPGGEISETLETGLAAAVAGGFTSVCAMPNTRPVNDNIESTRGLIEAAQAIGLARVFPIAAVSKGSEGVELTDFEQLVEAGAVAFSDDGRPVKTADLMRQAMEKALFLEVPIIDHCEDPKLSAGGAINQGTVSERLGLKGISNASEDVCVARDLGVAEVTGAHLHVAHLSTAQACKMVREAKGRGVRATCEVTPHHFTLTDDAIEKYGTHAKMNPPLRGSADLSAILAAIADGTVDALATDHAPHAPELKAKPIAEAPFGVIGFETALALALTQLVHGRKVPLPYLTHVGSPSLGNAVPARKISLPHLIVLMSTNPARIIRQRVNPNLGRLKLGGIADITLFDPECDWTYRAAGGRSKSRNSPFEGWTFKGLVTTTIVAGKVVYG